LDAINWYIPAISTSILTDGGCLKAESLLSGTPRQKVQKAMVKSAQDEAKQVERWVFHRTS